MPAWRIPPPYRLRQIRAAAIASRAADEHRADRGAEALAPGTRTRCRTARRTRRRGRPWRRTRSTAGRRPGAGPRPRRGSTSRSCRERRRSGCDRAATEVVRVLDRRPAGCDTWYGTGVGLHHRQRLGRRRAARAGATQDRDGDAGVRGRCAQLGPQRCGRRLSAQHLLARGRPAAARPARWPSSPVGMNRAASCPNSSATRCSSSATVGSSPYTSSPTSARPSPAHGLDRAGQRVAAQVDRRAQAFREHLGDQERQLQRLLVVQPRVAQRSRSAAEVGSHVDLARRRRGTR